MKRFYGLSILALLFLLSLPQVYSQNVLQKFSISGTIKDDAGTAIQGVSVQLGGSKYLNVQTDLTGAYRFDSLQAGKYYSVTPTKAKYKFTPPLKVFENLNENKILPFTGVTVKYLSISGTITSNSGPLSGVTVTIIGGKVGKMVTDNTGAYKFDSLEAGKYYIVTPLLKNTTFTPELQKFENLTENKVQNFSASAIQLYSISGYTKDKNGLAISGATITLYGDLTISSTAGSNSGLTRKVITDNTGLYKFDSLTAGRTFIVQPNLARYVFDPRTTQITKIAKNETCNFTGTYIAFYSISGKIKDASGNGITETTVTITGGKTAKILTDGTGAYKFDSLEAGRYYNVIPVKKGYSFDPINKSFDNLQENKTQDFVGNQVGKYSISGAITDKNQLPLAGVTVHLMGSRSRNVLTDNTGLYKFDTVETKPAIIIMPEKKGYTFDPKSVTFENIASNKIQNFIGSAPALYTISGFVKDTNSDPLAATMILTGQKNRKILVDSITGYYQFDSLEAGKTFAVFPSRRGYKFTPNIKVFGTLASSQTQDFVGVKLVKDSLQTISGIISGNQGSFLKTSDFNLAGITVYLDDDNNNYVTQTDNSGIFVFDDVDLSPNYTITPYQAGTAFYPASQAIDATKDDNQPDMFISSISSATGVEPVTNQLPGEIHLYNNYPNPFNPSTIIKYSLPSTLDVKIEVYDIMGRLVTKLFDGKQNSGNYEITFNAGNISSGVYFVKLRSGSTVKSISINLLK